MKKLKKYRFTLIEIVVVMALMAALLALMLPSFNKMINGSKVDQMASNIKLGLEKAQSLAVTERRYVAVIFPSNVDSWSDLKDFCYGGYRLAYVKMTSESRDSWTFLKWVDGSKWENPRKGAALVYVYNGTNTAYDHYTDATPPAERTYSGLTGSGDSVEANTLQKAFDEPLVALNGTNAPSGKCAVVFSPYGGVKTSCNSIKFIVAEVLENGNNFVYPNKGTDGAMNFLVLGLNKLTGRVDYR